MPSFPKLCSNLNAAIKRQQVCVKTPFSNLNARTLEILVMEGFIRSFNYINSKQNQPVGIEVNLSFKDSSPTFKQIISVSNPGRRVYYSHKGLVLWRNKVLGAAKNKYFKNFRNVRMILSTSKGIITENQAIAYGIGGEVLCKIVI